MTSNVGTIDRAARLILGLVLIIAPLINLFGIWSSDAWGYSAMAVGAVLVATAFMRFCPMYRIFGLSSCKV